MDLITFIYLADVLPNIGEAMCFASIITFLVFLVLCIVETLEGIEIRTKPFIVAACVCLFIGVITPSERAMYMMAGASVTSQAVESEAGKRVLRKLEQKLDELLGTETPVKSKGV